MLLHSEPTGMKLETIGIRVRRVRIAWSQIPPKNTAWQLTAAAAGYLFVVSICLAIANALEIGKANIVCQYLANFNKISIHALVHINLSEPSGFI
jgi:hypothetical protein